MKYREMVPLGVVSFPLRSKGVCIMDINEASWTVFLPKLFKKIQSSVLQNNLILKVDLAGPMESPDH